MSDDQENWAIKVGTMMLFFSKVVAFDQSLTSTSI